MKTLEQILDILEDKGITTYELKEDKILCGYELNTYSAGGVNQIVFLDFREEGDPNEVDDFIQKFSEYIDEIDIDEEVELHRQSQDYKNRFSVRQSLEDFEHWREFLRETKTLMEATIHEKAIERLSIRGIEAKEENDTVYVVIDGVELELARDEIIYQAREYDELGFEDKENDKLIERSRKASE